MATIILKHSTVKDKLPSSAQFGEVFVNYNNENPFLATLNNQGQFEKFLSENKTKELFYTKSQVNNIIANIESGGTIEFDDYYKKNEVDTLLQSKSDIGHTHSYTALTDLPDLSIYLTEHQSLENYYTKSEADGKFLTTHQDLSGYALKSDLDDYLTIASASTIYATKEELEEHIPTVDAYTKAETDVLLAGKANSAHTHDYSEIQNTPDLSGYASLSDVPKIWKGTLAEYTNLTDIDPDTLYVITDESEQFVTSGDVESMISGFTNLTEVQTLLEGYSTTSHTHSYNDLTDKPTIPSTTGLASETWVGQNFQPQSGMSEYSTTAHTHDYSEIENTPDLSGFASLSDIPDVSNFITSGFCEDHYQPKGTYVVPSDLDDYALKTDLPTVPDSYTKTETDNLLAGKANSAHTHSYEDLTDKPTIPSIEGLATEAELANYQPVSAMTGYSTTAHTHSYNDLEDKPTIPSIEGLATEAELANYQPVSSMTDYALVSQIPSTTGLASETWVGQNFQPQSGMSEYSTTAHTHSQYITQTSADSRYARVVSCTQAEYDALVQNDQVEQGVLYCITESNS